MSNEDAAVRLGLTIKSLLRVISEDLSDKEKEVLVRLAEYGRSSDATVDGTIDDVIGSLDEMKTILSEMADKYDRGRKVVLPPREVRRFSFNPFRVRYRKRIYGGDPLAFYFKHKEEFYEGLNRKRLQQFDPGLFKELKYSNQLNESVPTTQKSTAIIAAYEPFDGCVKRVSRELGFHHVTVSKYWKSVGLQPKGRSGAPSLSIEKREELRSALIRNKGNQSKTTRETGIARDTMVKYCHDIIDVVQSLDDNEKSSFFDYCNERNLVPSSETRLVWVVAKAARDSPGRKHSRLKYGRAWYLAMEELNGHMNRIEPKLLKDIVASGRIIDFAASRREGRKVHMRKYCWPAIKDYIKNFQ